MVSHSILPAHAQSPETLSLEEMASHLIERARAEPEFKQALCNDPRTVWQQTFEAVDLAEIQVTVLEETKDTLYLVIPTDDDAIKQALTRKPQAIWQQQFGTRRLHGYTIRVMEETPEQLYLILPASQRGNAPFLQRIGQRIQNIFKRPTDAEP